MAVGFFLSQPPQPEECSVETNGICFYVNFRLGMGLFTISKLKYNLMSSGTESVSHGIIWFLLSDSGERILILEELHLISSFCVHQPARLDLV